MTHDRAHLTDEALMEAFREGDEQAFEVLFHRYANPIRRMLVRLCGSPSAASDLTQETFVSLVRGRGRFVRGSRFKPWIYTIALNAFRDSCRLAKREVLTASGQTPEEVEESRIGDPVLEEKVREALERLPSVQREAVVLHVFMGFGFREIAEMAGLSESAAKVRAHRGYQHLRKLLGGIWREHAG